MFTLRRWRSGTLVVILTVAAVVAASAYKGASPSAHGNAAAEAQDLTSLERRISMLEQRFYGVESSINRLEQQSRLSQRTPLPQSGERTMEINLLRSEMEMLQRRLVEIECGLSKLDERTLTPTARETRRRAGTGNADPCRLSPESPLRLSMRP